MKKLILTILASSFLLSCSSDSSNDDSNNPSGNGLLLKTETDYFITPTTITYNYNGYKINTIEEPDGSSSSFTYNGDFIIKIENLSEPSTITMNYLNDLLVSENQISASGNTFTNITYNSDGSITENNNDSNGNPISRTIRFYSQGNCIKQESYSSTNGLMTLTGTILSTFDNKNSPYKNITGLYLWCKPLGMNVNNALSITSKNADGIVTSVTQFTYQYNSQNYPVSKSRTYIPYTISPGANGGSFPGVPGPSTISNTYTYY
jgi:hypothetical protein